MRFHKERGESKVGGWVGAAPLSAHLRPGPCVIMHCRLRRHNDEDGHDEEGDVVDGDDNGEDEFHDQC